MKTDINTVLNKLTSFACDNLMLDALDYTYTLNRLACLAGVTPKKQDADYGDSDLNSLVAELKAAVPAIDEKAVVDALMPLAHTIDYYFTDALGRSADKAFEFIYDLFAQCGSVSNGVELASKGYTFYSAPNASNYSVSLDVGGDSLMYTPVSTVGRVAALECPDLLAYDVASRLASFAETYGCAIAKTAGDDSAYLCCKSTALSSAKVKEQLNSGVVKTALLDYPVPTLSVSGPKNAASRECARIMKAAADAEVKCVVAAEPGQFTTLYIVFAGATAKDENFMAGDALSACGVVKSLDFAPLMSVLEKGTALSTDLFEYKSIYGDVGGVKHGAKAAAALSDALAKKFNAVLAAVASADEAKVKSFAVEENK